MSNRERWTVYPLLFLTLGIVLKDKLTKIISTDRVYCKMLVVTDHNQQERVVVSSNPAGGIVKADSSNRRLSVLLGHVGNQFGLMYADASGKIIPMTFLIRSPLQPPSANSESEVPNGAPPANHDNRQPGAENQDSPEPLPEEPAK